MTIDDIKAIDRPMLYATDIAELMESNPASIRRQAHEDPDKLGFPVSVIGSRVLIPKEGFLHFVQYGRTVIEVSGA